MTESQVETLLQQMTLSEPSKALDQRIAGTLQAPYVAGSNRSRVWSVVSATAIACLLLGVAVGRATVAPEHNGINNFAAPKKVETPDIHVVNIGEVESAEFDSLVGPAVALLCGMVEVDGQRRQCVDCHAGLSAAESHFPKEHIKHPSFATCMLCHDGTESTDGIVDDLRRSF